MIRINKQPQSTDIVIKSILKQKKSKQKPDHEKEPINKDQENKFIFKENAAIERKKKVTFEIQESKSFWSRTEADRRYPPDSLEEREYYFGIISMIGGYLDQDMQYDQVMKKILKHRYEHIQKPKKIFLPIIEQTNQNEEDSDFEELPQTAHQDDLVVH